MTKPAEHLYLVLDCETKGEIERDANKQCIFRPDGCWPRIFQGLVSNESGEFQRYYVWDTKPESVEDMLHTIESVDLVTGWAIDGFDVPAVNAVASHVCELSLEWPQTADLMRMMSTSRYFRLNDVLRVTMGLEKTGSGKDAPTMPWAQLVSYGINDVHLENMAFRFAVKYGYLVTPNGYQRAVDIPGWNDTDHVFRYDASAKKEKPAATGAQMKLLGQHLGDEWPNRHDQQQDWLRRNMRSMRQLLLEGRPSKYQASAMIEWFNNKPQYSKKAGRWDETQN